MPQFTADLIIEARWILPMTDAADLLENHSLVIANGRIAGFLPPGEALRRFENVPAIQRPHHLLMPGLVNARCCAGTSLLRALPAEAPGPELRRIGADFARDAVLLSIAEMIQGGITCFGDAGIFPDETARAAAEQGIRACVGLPVADAETSWARTAGEHISKALSLRDEYKGHPVITTRFAPRASETLSDETLTRVRTLADELDTGVCMPLHRSAAEIQASQATFGLRPIARLERLGLLTPALNAAYMAHVSDADLESAARSGLSATICPVATLRSGLGSTPAKRLAGSGIELSLGSGGAAAHGVQDIWHEARTVALLCGLPAWDALTIATRGGAAALGLSEQIGTLEAGKWADICCIDLDHPAMQPFGAPVDHLIFCGGRDRVSDVWIAGRQLMSEFRLTRLDWQQVSSRAASRAASPKC